MNLPYAVLDLKFTRFKKGFFATATSKGQVGLWTIKIDGSGPMEHIRTYQIFPEPTMTLSLAWNPLPSQSNAIAASSSDGRIAIFDTKHEPPATYAEITPHSLEAWTLAWTSKGANDLRPDLYSGGDDSALCRHDLVARRLSASINGSNISPADYEFLESTRDIKTHMAGVTAILPLGPIFRNEQVILTGSYDEHIRLLLLVDGSPKPRLLAERRLGGGVWSLKVLDHQSPDNNWGMEVL